MTNPPIRQSIMQSQAMASQPDDTEVGLVVRGAGHFDAHTMTAPMALGFHGEYENRHGYTRHIMGRRTSFTAGVYNDCVEWLSNSASVVWPNSSTALRMKSSQAGDSATGSGTSQVEIIYISADSGYVGQELTYATSMNGTNYVNLPFRAQAINNFEAIDGDGSETSLGNITIENSNSATTILSQITVGGNKAMGAFYMVPASHTAYLDHWDCGAIQNTMDARLRATVATYDRRLISRYLFQGNAYLAADDRETEKIDGQSYPAGARIKVSAIPGSTAAGIRLDASFYIIVLEDH